MPLIWARCTRQDEEYDQEEILILSPEPIEGSKDRDFGKFVAVGLDPSTSSG
jgi:hypothetical protein